MTSVLSPTQMVELTPALQIATHEGAVSRVVVKAHDVVIVVAPVAENDVARQAIGYTEAIILSHHVIILKLISIFIILSLYSIHLVLIRIL